MRLAHGLRWREVSYYALPQVIGGCLGTLVAHAMFDLPLLQVAAKARTGSSQWLAEFIATFGLLMTIITVVRFRAEAIPYAVGLYITAAYWFTASTSFANPAVTVARALTDTFAGIALNHVVPFILPQTAGALAGAALARWFIQDSRSAA
jgi:glycerol uptake facilitator-like aquaporin